MLRQSGLIPAYAVSILLGFNPVFTQAKPHEHGVAQLEISLSGNDLQLRFVSALDSFLVGSARRATTKKKCFIGNCVKI